MNRTARALARSPRVYPGNPNTVLASFILMPCLEERAARTSMCRAPPRAFSRRRTRMEVGTPLGIARLRSFAPCGLTGCIWTVRAGSTYVPVVDARNDSYIAFFFKSGVDLVAFRGAPHSAPPPRPNGPQPAPPQRCLYHARSLPFSHHSHLHTHPSLPHKPPSHPPLAPLVILPPSIPMQPHVRACGGYLFVVVACQCLL